MKRSRITYPVTVADVRENLAECEKIFVKKRIHRGAFIGLSLLEGVFTADDPQKLFDSLVFGEKLLIKRDESFKKSKRPPLSALRSDGSEAGILPFSESLLPDKLISLGKEVYCFIEAKSFGAGIPDIAVSVYCEDY